VTVIDLKMFGLVVAGLFAIVGVLALAGLFVRWISEWFVPSCRQLTAKEFERIDREQDEAGNR
jgi:hypothetical protein